MASLQTGASMPSGFDPAAATSRLDSPNLNDDVNWANWDDMVREFGMDIDQNGETNIFAGANGALEIENVPSGARAANPYQGYGGLRGWF